MKVHFTYSETIDGASLKQGDVLKKTDELAALIKEIHPHYSNDEYTHFQVLTQSCDLVRRGKSKSCSSRYVTLAAVKSLNDVIQRAVDSEVDKTKQIAIEKYKWCSDKHKPRISSTLGSLLNNNDKSHFFLKAYPDKGLPEDACTFLHLSIALRSYQHYDLLLAAKIIELESNFQSKLGWLVGNLYSRVGTADQIPHCFPNQKEFDLYLSEILNAHVIWVEHSQYALFKSLHTKDSSLSGEELVNAANLEAEKKSQQNINAFVDLIGKTIPIDKTQKDKLKNLFSSAAANRFLKI